MSVFYFGDVMPSATATRLAAAIVWRHDPSVPSAQPPRWGRGPLGWLRRLRQHVWLRLGALGLDVSLGGAHRRKSEGGAVASVGLLGDEEPRAYYDGSSVRLLGRVYDVPAEGPSLVLLVDEGGERSVRGRADAAPRITVRTVSVPPVVGPALDPPSLVEARASAPELSVRTGAMVGGRRPEWETALRADPAVRAFMEASADD